MSLALVAYILSFYQPAIYTFVKFRHHTAPHWLSLLTVPHRMLLLENKHGLQVGLRSGCSKDVENTVYLPILLTESPAF